MKSSTLRSKHLTGLIDRWIEIERGNVLLNRAMVTRRSGDPLSITFLATFPDGTWGRHTARWHGFGQ